MFMGIAVPNAPIRTVFINLISDLLPASLSRASHFFSFLLYDIVESKHNFTYGDLQVEGSFFKWGRKAFLITFRFGREARFGVKTAIGANAFGKDHDPTAIRP